MIQCESDESLVRRSQSGDRHAFEELVRRTARLVYSQLYLDVGDVHRAEDLTQETFLLAWRSIHQVDDPKGLRPWLLAIGRSAMLDAARREGRKKRRGAEAAPRAGLLRIVADPSSGPPEAVEREEERQRVLSLLRSLPAEYREPLMLRYIAGANHDAIGQQLGLTNGSLRGLLHRGMSRLREEMKRLNMGSP